MNNPAMEWPEIKVWRRATRTKMLAARAALSTAVRQDLSQRLAARLKPVLAGRPGPVSLYWPIKAEPDLRPLMRALDAEGVAVCLPVAIKLGEPLRFRPWHRGCAMERGFWDIPVPATTEEVEPRTLIAPIVGFDGEGYRLGYGGGFFDRTLEKFGAGKTAEASQAIGIGYSMFRIPTIHPQPHDIRMAAIVTESEAFNDAPPNPSSAVCYAGEAEAGYAGFATGEEIAARFAGLRPALPPERVALLDYALWRLGAEPTATEAGGDSDAIAELSALLPRIRDDAVHAAISALRDSLAG
ncbi:MAG TPA: 5-formyltetrahydrofolate cyclo-ligase [Dongiaceae bacterium]|jgi:5,10-methenyltetrahydrofolate synthetase